ncbi:MAG: hypothetical protein HLX49_07035, partial [Virgibacillus sp.]|nr:hypothetical protein [Virgibacillus sp.]
LSNYVENGEKMEHGMEEVGVTSVIAQVKICFQATVAAMSTLTEKYR